MSTEVMQAIVCGVPVLLIAGLFIFLSNANAKEAERRQNILKAAQNAYQNSLAKLKQSPTDADIKQKTLELGRYYSNLTRQQQGVTVYDEMALGNDISAATAGATVAAAPTAASVEERLKTIDELRSRGMISDAEHAERRKKILEAL